MIAHLKGLLASTGIDHAVVDVGGVGYLVGMSSRSLSPLGAVGEAVTVHTEMLVGEDFLAWWAFPARSSVTGSGQLTGVQGVGCDVGPSPSSALEPAELHQRHSGTGQGDGRACQQGVGLKLAERIVRELKDKIRMIATGITDDRVASAAVVALAAPAFWQGRCLVRAGLLGFKPGEASMAVVRAGRTGRRRHARCAGADGAAEGGEGVNETAPNHPHSGGRYPRRAGRLLLVRKRGTEAFRCRRAARSSGEEPVEALIRELHEELVFALPRKARAIWPCLRHRPPTS